MTDIWLTDGKVNKNSLGGSSKKCKIFVSLTSKRCHPEVLIIASYIYDTYIYIYIYIYIYMYIYICIYVCKIYTYMLHIYIYMYVFVYVYIYHICICIYVPDWEGIQYNITDITSVVLGNLQSIFFCLFYLQKQKDFISNRKQHTVKTNAQ